MKIETQTLEPRSQFITRSTRIVLRETKLCGRKFATAVAEEYDRRTALHERIVRFYTGNGGIDSALKAEKRNAQIVDRFLSGAVKFPCDLEESWLAALPLDARTRIQRGLAERYGMIGARMPEPHHALADLADVLHDAGRTASALAPCFATGQLSDTNVPALHRSAHDIERGIADLVSLLQQVKAALARHTAGGDA